jgi:hypothetical protein
MNMSGKYSDPADKPYFYGRLLREEANRILEKRGNRDGLFLLRESVFEVGSFILSLCSANVVQHYKIERQEDGTVAIGRTGTRFVGPIELIRHHQSEQSGLVTRPLLPCNRSDENGGSAVVLQPIKYLFIHDVDFYKLVNQEIQKHMGLKLKANQSMSKQEYDAEMEEAKGRYRYKYEKIVTKNIHFTQSWFRRDLTREEASKMLKESGLEDGKFLVRTNTSKSSISNGSSSSDGGGGGGGGSFDQSLDYKISLCFKNEIKHYQIKAKVFTSVENLVECHYFIDDSFEFDTIIQLVDYFHRCSVGFLCNLRIAYMPPIQLNDTLIDSKFYFRDLF